MIRPHPARLSVLILGYGEMGHATAHLLRSRHELTVWQRRPHAGAPVDLPAAAARADAILFCVPAVPHHELALRLRPALRSDAVCVSVAKGLDEAGRTAAQALTAALGESQPCAFLYGPMIAEEIRADRPAFAELGATSSHARERVRALFAGTRLALVPTNDITGIAWSAILKNVYALLFGMADGLGLGDNMRGYLATAALEELGRLVTTLGGSAGTVVRLAGIGDLITTATSAGSHHHALGVALARGEAIELKGEGVNTLAMVRRHRLFDTRAFALFHLADRIVHERADPRALLDAHLQALRSGP